MIVRTSLIFVICQLTQFKVSSTDNCNNRLIDVSGFASSLAQQLFTFADPAFETERKNKGVNVSFSAETATNAQFTAGLAATSESDHTKPMLFMVLHQGGQLTTNELRFPLYGAAVVIVYNLPGVSLLNLTISLVANIYKGKITNWNDSRIATYNPNAVLPDKKILPLARYDSDASTGLLTQVLTANDQEWASSYGVFFDPGFNYSNCSDTDTLHGCVSTTWSNDVIYDFVTKVVGMIGRLVSVPYTIGYASYSAIAEYDVSKASIASKLHPNVSVSCSKEGIQNAMSYYMNISDPKNLTLQLTSKNMPEDAYPFSNLGYMAVNQTYVASIDCCSIRELVGFINWFMFEGNDEKITHINFIPIPDELKAKVMKMVLKNVVCKGQSAYDKYIESKITVLPYSLESWVVVLIVASVCFVVLTAGCYVYYVCYKRIQADESRWIISSKRIKMLVENRSKNSSSTVAEEVKSIFSNSFDSKSRKTNSAGRGGAAIARLQHLMVPAQLDDNKISLDRLETKSPQQWKISSKRLMSKMKNFNNKNVAPLIGATVFDKETFIVCDFCAKGTLHYVLRTARYSITDPIKYQFAIDIGQAMKFLHQHSIIHGHLSSLTCYLDSSWTVKVAQWEQLPLYLEENPIKIHHMTTYNPDTLLDETDLIKLLYVDPDLKQKVHEYVDVFSFGLLLIEIFTRQLPYTTEVEEGLLSYTEILSQKFNQQKIAHPKLNRVPNKIVVLSNACTGTQNQRPLFPKILSEMKGMTKITSGIVDIILDTLESHAEKLEEKVEERTIELKEMTSRMRILLNEVLPPQIATKLFNGEPVPPEFYECVSVYFSDIVGFTTISARSTPIEVMTLLNDLWLAFDGIIDKYDVYKVDTIGDAYMVCSGLPNRNGMAHCNQIALLALHLLDTCNNFKMKHLPNEQLKIRIGLNSGPVTAGIVGSKMPQYCVFGDTVNTAARMESTSEPQKIQISDITQKFLRDHFPNDFDIVYRGETTVKGKGMMSTYWLLGKTSMNLIS